MKVKNKALLGQLSDIDVRLLQVFRTVVDCGGLSAAELELNINVSTVSRHLKDLETRLGLTLCQRGRAGFFITPEGQQVYALVIALQQAMNTFRSGIEVMHQQLAGQLQIAVFEKTATNPNARIAQALADFVQQAPNVEVSLHVRPINEIERGVIDASFDLGIIPSHRESACLNYDPLFFERMQLYCSRSHPLANRAHQQLNWADLSHYQLAGLAYHSPNMQMSHRMGCKRSAHAYDQEGVAMFLLSGQFIGFLPTHYATGFVNTSPLVAISPDTLNYEAEFFAISRRSSNSNRASILFKQCLIAAHDDLN
jgi:DNA-binding transcriptional LysR family regulator